LSLKLDGGLFSNEKKRQDRTRLHGDGELFHQTSASTPFDKTIRLKARVIEFSEDRATVEAELIADDKVAPRAKVYSSRLKKGTRLIIAGNPKILRLELLLRL
jgi:hypothetical protein